MKRRILISLMAVIAFLVAAKLGHVRNSSAEATPLESVIVADAKPSGPTCPPIEYKEALPSGKWFASCAPARKRGTVVDVYKVTTDASLGLTATRFWVENRSNRQVAAVKLGWKVYDLSKPDVVLLKGRMADFIRIDLAPSERLEVNYPVVSFAKISQPLLKNGQLFGSYRTELEVVDVRYGEGGTFIQVTK